MPTQSFTRNPDGSVTVNPGEVKPVGTVTHPIGMTIEENIQRKQESGIMSSPGQTTVYHFPEGDKPKEQPKPEPTAQEKPLKLAEGQSGWYVQSSSGTYVPVTSGVAQLVQTNQKTQAYSDFWSGIYNKPYVPPREYGSSTMTSTNYPEANILPASHVGEVQASAWDILKPVKLYEEQKALIDMGITPNVLTNIGFASRELSKGIIVGGLTAIPSTIMFMKSAGETVVESTLKRDPNIITNRVMAGVTAFLGGIREYPGWTGGAIIGQTLVFKGLQESWSRFQGTKTYRVKALESVDFVRTQEGELYTEPHIYQYITNQKPEIPKSIDFLKFGTQVKVTETSGAFRYVITGIKGVPVDEVRAGFIPGSIKGDYTFYSLLAKEKIALGSYNVYSVGDVQFTNMVKTIWEGRMTPSQAENVIGFTNVKEPNIYVRNSLTDIQYQYTARHEMFHQLRPEASEMEVMAYSGEYALTTNTKIGGFEYTAKVVSIPNEAIKSYIVTRSGDVSKALQGTGTFDVTVRGVTQEFGQTAVIERGRMYPVEFPKQYVPTVYKAEPPFPKTPLAKSFPNPLTTAPDITSKVIPLEAGAGDVALMESLTDVSSITKSVPIDVTDTTRYFPVMFSPSHSPVSIRQGKLTGDRTVSIIRLSQTPEVKRYVPGVSQAEVRSLEQKQTPLMTQALGETVIDIQKPLLVQTQAQPTVQRLAPVLKNYQLEKTRIIMKPTAIKNLVPLTFGFRMREAGEERIKRLFNRIPRVTGKRQRKNILPTSDLLSIESSLGRYGSATLPSSLSARKEFSRRLESQGVFMRFPTTEQLRRRKI